MGLNVREPAILQLLGHQSTLKKKAQERVPTPFEMSDVVRGSPVTVRAKRLNPLIAPASDLSVALLTKLFDSVVGCEPLNECTHYPDVAPIGGLLLTRRQFLKVNGRFVELFDGESR